MTNTLQTLILAAIILCSTTVWAQTETDKAASQVMQKIEEALLEGDCDRAERNYATWKTLTGGTNPLMEDGIRNCQNAKSANQIKQIVEEALLQGDCNRAQINYNQWKVLTKKTNNATENSITECNNKSATNDKGVIINGVKWATRNIGNWGTFVSTPEFYGNYYAFDKNPCPKGWRIPTHQEFQTLINAGSIWTVQNGTNGRKYGSGNNTIFLPACGTSHDGLHYVGINGIYWSSTRNNTSAYFLNFNNEKASVFDYGKPSFGFGIRCVAE